LQGRRDTGTLGTRARWTAALGLSLGCHALLLAMLPMLGTLTFLHESPIAVTLLGDAGGGGSIAPGDGDGGGGAARHAEDAPPPEAEDARMKPAEDHVAALTPPPVIAPRPRAHPARRDDARQVAARPEHAPLAADGAGSGAATSGGGGGVPGDGAGSREGSGAGSGGGSGQGIGSARGDGAGGDLRAACASCPAPEYPARARRQGWQGTVDVDVRVGGDGAVEEASVGRSSGFAALDTAAVTVARRSRFRVAGGTAVNGQLRYRFVLESGERPL